MIFVYLIICISSDLIFSKFLKGEQVLSFEGSIYLKNRHFLSKKELINWYIYGINMIIKCGIWEPVKFQLVSHLWTG